MKTCNNCDHFFWICIHEDGMDTLKCMCRENGNKRFEFSIPNITIFKNEKEEKEIKMDIPIPDWCPKEAKMCNSCAINVQKEVLNVN